MEPSAQAQRKDRVGSVAGYARAHWERLFLGSVESGGGARRDARARRGDWGRREAKNRFQSGPPPSVPACEGGCTFSIFAALSDNRGVLDLLPRIDVYKPRF